MLFSDNPHDRQIEKLMSQIPNFKPRGHGILSERSDSNFFVRDPKHHYVLFDPCFARISTALRMTRTKKRKAKP